MKKLALLLLIGAAGCSDHRQATSSRELEGSQSERIAAVSGQFTGRFKLPSFLLDAHYLRDSSDGVAEYRLLKVDPTDLPKWREQLLALEELNTPAKYTTPKSNPAWWPPFSRFLQFQFYSQQPLTGVESGWLGIAPGSGEIFIYSANR